LTDTTAVNAFNIIEIPPPFNIDICSWTESFIVLIDFLIGASLFYEQQCVGQVKILPGLLLMRQTQLGWVVSGGCN